MIGYLRGTLAHKDPPQLVVEVAGVGYEVEAPMSTWSRLPDIGQAVQLRTHLVIREDQHLLFGFITEAERALFRDLLKVNGVGARIALAILSGISVDGLVRCVQVQDSAALTKVPGVGRKTAERLIVELRDRVEKMVAGGAATGANAAGASLPGTPEGEVLDALLALGYKATEARRMVEQAAAAGGGNSTADLLRAALKAAASNGRG